MHIIPVIDLKGGAVVRARGGHRAAYAPIETRLAKTSAPNDVVAGLLTLHPFDAIYAADLDAIDGSGDHADVLRALGAKFPHLTFWFDAGFSDAAGARAWLCRHGRQNLVLGSESLKNLSPLEQLRGEPRVILSLDFRGDRLVGPEALLAAQPLWPSRVIVMMLDRVGADAGPDVSRLAAIKRAGGAEVYAAGGVRGPADLAAVARAGAHGALVASALHDGNLSSAEFWSKRPK